MDAIKSMAMAFCGAAVAAGVVSMLLPSGKMEKVMRMLLGFFLIAAVLSPIMGVDEINWSLPDSPSADGDAAASALSQTVADQELQAVKDTLSGQITGALEGLGIFGAEVVLDMDIDEDGRISIRQTEVYLPAGTGKAPQAVQASLQDSLGIEAEVYGDGEIK
ncbi:MAG TPA: stage III sporulation protein AF [Firmicutes bacterium]|nr:stage III sporulation protein AF [Bacillota bacterium]